MTDFPDALSDLFGGPIALPNTSNLPEQLFAVITWGCAATQWLSKALNSHPDIFCSHWMNRKSTKIAKEKYLKKSFGLNYMHLLAKGAIGYKAAGDVHGILHSQVPELRRMFGDKFNAAVVVREPISRLKSAASFWHYLHEQNGLWKIDYIDDLIKDKGITLPQKFDIEHKFFVHGASLLNSIKEEVSVGKIFRTEDLTTNPSILGELIQEISCGKVTTENESLSKMINIDRVNRHKTKGFEFDDWQIDAIKKVVDEKAWKLYSELGYSKPDFL